MKRVILMLLIGLSYCISFAQNNDTLKVHQGTYIQSFPLSNIDSITHDGGQFVSIYHNEQMSAYSVNNIDSIVIRPATGICYQIPEEQLNGWDDGVYYTDMLNENNSFYIVSHSDPEDGTRTVYLDNFSNDDITQSMALVFSSNNEIHDIFLAGYQFEAYPKEEYVTFVAYDKEGKAIDSFDVPYENDSDIASTRANSPRKAIEHYRIVNIRNFLGKAGRTIWNVADIGVKLEDGKYADILKDYLIGKLAGQFAKSFLGELTLAQLIDLYLKQLYENNKNWFMGSAGIEITSIKRASKSTISVEGEISNISTIPSTRLVASEYPNYIDGKLVYLREVPNYVLYGVAEGDSGQPGLYLHDACTTPVVVSGSHFSCTLPVGYKPGKTFYFRPFLVPGSHFEESADFGQAVGKMVSTNIRYGNRKEYTDQNDKICPDENHPHMINLGLPSGTKWACCNVGATTPEEYGDYFAWGETQPKESYTESNYIYRTDTRKGDHYLLQNLGSDIAGTEYDAATVNWGEQWRMPSYAQIKELRQHCTSTWTIKKGKEGRMITGPNGGKIFLPAAGRIDQAYNSSIGRNGYYPSSNPLVDNPYDVWGLKFSDFSIYCDDLGRPDGYPIRPVLMEDKENEE